MTPGVREWLGDPALPWLHFAHATGMCAEIYAELLEPLANDFNIVASDARGHGRSPLPADPAAMTSWRIYEDDLAALLAIYSGGPWVLAGHSMGGTVSLGLAAGRLGIARAIVLVEPAFVPFALAPSFTRGPPNPMAEQAAKRRSVFPNRDAARDNWRGRGVFRDWSEASLDAYVRGALRERSDGQVELACAPAWEAATFIAVATDAEASLAAWQGPLALLHGTRSSTVTQADADAFAARGTVERIEGASHFLPLEHPERVRAAIRAAAALPDRA